MMSSRRCVRGGANFSAVRIYSIQATGANFLGRRDLHEESPFKVTRRMLMSNAAKSEEEVSALFASTICHDAPFFASMQLADAYK